MGEVYRARDKRLDRTVAIKVLPAELSGRTEMRQRLEREARTISSLSHPNICPLFDVGETADGSMYLVMEYLEGESLAERLGRGPMPLRQAIRVGMEIAAALDGAHRQQIVHRDLKPGNVMLTKAGVRLLDFGLAKPAATGSLLASDQDAPTLQQPSVTEEGTIVGTLHYMAPEQLEGKPADARSDIFAFGATLYEMLCGKRAFEATSRVGVVAKILHEEPEPLTGVPSALARVIEHCLKKDPDERWQTAGDIAIQLRGLGDASSEKADAVRPGSRRKWWPPVAALLLVALGVAGAIAWQRFRPRTSESRFTHVSLSTGLDQGLSIGEDNSALAVSPDGKFVVFAATGADGVQALYTRRFDSFEITRVPGTERALNALVSPDSTEIAFMTDGKLRRVSLAGGPSEVICDSGPSTGGSWGSDGMIVFNPMPAGPLFRVPAAGGEAVRLTSAPNTAMASYHPEAGVLLYVVEVDGKSFDDAEIVALSLETKQTKVVTRGTAPHYVPSAGQLVFARNGKVWSVNFDSKTMSASGTPVPVAEPVMIYPGTGQALFDVTPAGDVVFAPVDIRRIHRRLMQVDRGGVTKPLPFPPNLFESPRLSGDGRLLSVEMIGANNDVWMGDMARGTINRITTAKENLAPILSPDGRFVITSRLDHGPPNLTLIRTDGVGEPVTLLPAGRPRFAYSFSRDGRKVAFIEFLGDTRTDISLLDIAEKRAVPLFHSRFEESEPSLSPDGKWIAYVSDETGRAEVYVRAIESEGTKLRISTEGGTEPLWSRRGGELFYRKANALYAVDVATAGGLKTGEPKKLFEVPMNRRDVTRSYDVLPDDSGFVYVERADATRMNSINIVTNALDRRDR